ARSSAAVLTEGLVQLHERDGRGWKAEWVALPEVCLLTGAALRTARAIVGGLEVDADAMAANLADLAATLVGRGQARAEEVDGWIGAAPVGAAAEMVEAVLARAAAARALEPETWP
ncbi:MAG: adenylosuccinate lyase family protein, partial [Pseudonocardiaceae bacterium]